MQTRWFWTLVCGFAVGSWPGTGDAAVVRYQAIRRGDVAIAGNTLGLAHATSQNGPGTRGAIGTFISLNGSSVDNSPASPSNPWPAGTTSDWTQNGSRGPLTLPAGSTVLYAELVWGGSTNYGGEDVTASLNGAVTLAGPLGGTLSVTPDPLTAVTLSILTGAGFMANYYLRSANVTSLVVAQGAGTYSVSHVPATQNESISELNAAGWALVVAYSNLSAPRRLLTVVVDGTYVDENSESDISVTGFTAPAAGAVTGRVVAAALEGDAAATGDELLISSKGGPSVGLSGSNNPANNFFASQINDASGVLVTTGSFGTLNHDAALAVNVSGARQSWDTTGVALSSAAGQLVNGQTSATIRAITLGDTYLLAAVGFAVDMVPLQAPALGPIALGLLAVGLFLVVASHSATSSRRAAPPGAGARRGAARRA